MGRIIRMSFASTITRLINTVFVIFVLSASPNFYLYAQLDTIESFFLLRKKSISIEIYNQSNDSLTLPSQAYWKVLDDSVVSASENTLFIDFISEVATIKVFGDSIAFRTVYLSDMLIKHKENRVLEYKFKNIEIKPSRINTLMLRGNGHFILASRKLSKRLIAQNRYYPISKFIYPKKSKKMYSR